MAYVGKLAVVNLTTQQVEIRDVTDDEKRLYIGSRGLGTKLWVDMVPDVTIDPMDPANPLIYAAGPLTGTSIMGGRFDVITKSPLTGTITSANSGGTFGPKLKRSGFDALVFTGKAEHPVYVVCYNGAIEIRDARPFWGQWVTPCTDNILQDVLSSVQNDDAKVRCMKMASISCIGPAGERGVLYSGTINDKSRSAGRGGVGAVMGSKNLKAVVVNGTTQHPVASQEHLNEVRRDVMEKINANGVCGLLKEHGTNVLTNAINGDYMYPTRNFQDSHDPLAHEISGEKVTETMLKQRKGCHACIIQCGRTVEIEGKRHEGPEYETTWAFGGDCDIHDIHAITEANTICNELGLDTISAGSTIACACELVQKGYCPGYEGSVAFGMPGEKLIDLVRKIGLREGQLATELGEGSYRFAERFGHPECSMTVKRQELPAYDPRGAQGQGLCYATSVRGGCHVYAYMIGPEVIVKSLDRFAIEGKAEAAKTTQDLTAAMDSLGVCIFASFAVGAEELAALYSAATGVDMSGDELLKAGDRCWTLQRRINERNGFTSADDTLPPRFLEQPLKEGPQQMVWRRDDLLPAYYAARGWTVDGLVPQSKMEELGLPAV